MYKNPEIYTCKTNFGTVTIKLTATGGEYWVEIEYNNTTMQYKCKSTEAYLQFATYLAALHPVNTGSEIATCALCYLQKYNNFVLQTSKIGEQELVNAFLTLTY